jgi:protein gp37
MTPDRVTRCTSTFNAPLARNRAKDYKWPDGDKVFTCSWSDFFHPDADPWRPEAWEIIQARPGLTFQILTKRPERIERELPTNWGPGYPNVWLGISAHNQFSYNTRWRNLRPIPAAIRFLSAEPLLDYISLSPYPDHPDWVITGGETGPDARPPKRDWFLNLRDQCESLSIPFFFKRWGTCCPICQNMFRLDGLQYHQFPQTEHTK